MYDEPDARAEIDASLQEIYAAMFITASPAPVKAALKMLGHDVGAAAAAARRVRRARSARSVHDVLAAPRAARAGPPPGERQRCASSRSEASARSART